METNPLLRGAVAGFIATLPMTIAMEWMHRQLPAQERYPLPPSEIVTVAEEVSIGEQLDEAPHMAATLVSHFAYGAAAGALYAPLARHVALPPTLRGVAFGMLVWSGSYLGLLPGLGILRPATEHPARRTALMIAAHVVWGATLGVIVDGKV